MLSSPCAVAKRVLPLALLLMTMSLRNADAVRVYDNYTLGQYHFDFTEPDGTDITNWDTGWGTSGITGWDYVGLIGNSVDGASGVYLSNGWVLTAKHVGVRTFTLGGVTYEAVPGSSISFGSTDLLMYKIFAAPDLPDLPELELATSAPGVATQTVLIGNGAGGSGQGERKQSWGTINVTSAGTSTFTTSGTTSGAAGISGDSGGAGFIYNSTSGTWELAGIMTNAGGLTTVLQSVYNTTNAAIIASALPLGYNYWTSGSSWISGTPAANDGTATVTLGSTPNANTASFIDVNYSVVDTPYKINRLEFIRPTVGTPTQTLSGETLTFSASGGVNPVLYIDNGGGTTFAILNDLVLEATLGLVRKTDGNYVVALGGDISGAGGISKDFTFSTLRLTGNNTFQGNVSISRGTLEIGSDTALGQGTLVLSSSTSSTGLTAYNGARTVGNAMTIGGVSPTDTSTVLITGTFTFNGNVTLNQGTSTNTKGRALAAASGASVTFNGDIGQDTSAGGTSRSLHLTGANVAEGSAGTFLIKGDGSYTGETMLGYATGTTISRAKVQIEGDLSTSARTSVYSGMIVSGTGRIAALSVTGTVNGGTPIFSVIDPGKSLRGQSGATAGSLGTLRVAGNADFLGNSVLRLQLGAAGAADRLALEGGGILSINATGTALYIDLLSGATLSEAYVLASYGAITGMFESVYFNGVLVADPTAEDSFGSGYRLSYGANQLMLIPEPGTMGLLAAGAGILAWWRNRGGRRNREVHPTGAAGH